MEKLNKGDYGYLSKVQKKSILIVLIYAAVVAALLIGGIIAYKTKNNVVTILAILVVLPGAKALVKCIMLCRFKATAKDEYEKIKQYENKNVILYDMVIAANDKVFFAPVMTVNKKDVFIYTQKPIKDQNKMETFISNFVKGNGHCIKVRITNDKELLYKHLESGCISEESVEGLINNLTILHI